MFVSDDNAKNRETFIPTASTADIAFLILIFFLVTTKIDIDKGIAIVLPGQDSVPIPPKNICEVLIDETGLVRMADDVVAPAVVEARAKALLKENDRLIFSIRTKRSASYEHYIRVLDQLRAAGATRISISSSEE